MSELRCFLVKEESKSDEINIQFFVGAFMIKAQFLFFVIIFALPFSGCISSSPNPSEGYTLCDGYRETGDEAMAISWNAMAENPSNSDQDVLMNIKMSNPCEASEFFYFNGSSECGTSGHVICIESIEIKNPSNEWEICSPSQDSLCTISINNGTSWDHNDLIIVQENGSDLFTDGDVIGDIESEDWRIIWVD